MRVLPIWYYCLGIFFVSLSELDRRRCCALRSYDCGQTNRIMDKPLTKAKRIPRGADGNRLEKFEANGNIYRWLDPSDIGIRRWTELANMMDVFITGFDSVSAIHKYMIETNRTIVKKEGVDAALYAIERNNSFLDAIIFDGPIKGRAQLSMHICACICLKEGDDIRKYSFDKGNSYINDWMEEGYSHVDFLALAGSLSNDFKDYYKAAESRAKQLQKQLEGVIGTFVKGKA